MVSEIDTGGVAARLITDSAAFGSLTHGITGRAT